MLRGSSIIIPTSGLRAYSDLLSACIWHSNRVAHNALRARIDLMLTVSLVLAQRAHMCGDILCLGWRHSCLRCIGPQEWMFLLMRSM
jgi:hypothetical protein